ncbi:MAG: TadE/TadG family type IV pilus assembly protein [Mycobacteriaceae bacterium]
MEFALVVPILLLVVFGIIDYGLYFSNALSARDGVREAARQAIVAKFNDGSSCTTGIPAAQLACNTDKFIGPITGTPYTKVVLVSGTWAQGKQLLVCSIVTKSGVTSGLVPLPNDGQVRASTRMAIEVVPTSSVPTADYTEGTSLDWSWCS